MDHRLLFLGQGLVATNLHPDGVISRNDPRRQARLADICPIHTDDIAVILTGATSQTWPRRVAGGLDHVRSLHRTSARCTLAVWPGRRVHPCQQCAGMDARARVTAAFECLFPAICCRYSTAHGFDQTRCPQMTTRLHRTTPCIDIARRRGRANMRGCFLDHPRLQLALHTKLDRHPRSPDRHYDPRSPFAPNGLSNRVFASHGAVESLAIALRPYIARAHESAPRSFPLCVRMRTTRFNELEHCGFEPHHIHRPFISFFHFALPPFRTRRTLRISAWHG